MQQLQLSKIIIKFILFLLIYVFPLTFTHTHTIIHIQYYNTATYNTDVYNIYICTLCVHMCNVCVCRANSMKDKEELFWRQGDFGYVNDVVESLMTLCQSKEQVIHY